MDGTILTEPVAADYPTFGGNPARTGRLDVESDLTTTPETRWQTNSVNISAFPVVDGNTLFTISNGRRLDARSTTTGEIRWSYNFEVSSFDAAPTVGRNHVYVTPREDRLVAVDKNSGEMAWESSLPSRTPSTLVLTDDLLFVTISGGRLWALDTETGHLLWSVQHSGEVVSAPAYATETVYYRTGGTLYAHEPRTGSLRWAQETESQYNSVPVVGDGRVYVTDAESDRSSVSAFDAYSGEQLWISREADAKPVPAVRDGMLYTRVAGNFSALDAWTGETWWRSELLLEEQPTVTDEHAYVAASREAVYCLDIERTEWVWGVKIPSEPKSPLVLADGTVYVNHGDIHTLGQLTALSSDP